MKKGYRKLFLLCFVCFLGIRPIWAAPALEMPYFDPYKKDFQMIAVDLKWQDKKLSIYVDEANETIWRESFYEELALKVKDTYMKSYESYFSKAEVSGVDHLKIIFTEALAGGENATHFQAYYTPLYMEQFGFEALLVNPRGLVLNEIAHSICHELFHLYYYRKFETPASWINEGLAQLFAYLISDDLPQSGVNSYFKSPDAALENFEGGQSKYYGNSFLFFYFLYLHYLKPEDLYMLISVDHPKKLFPENWQLVLKEFSVAKLLNMIYVHPNQHYSLQGVQGNVLADAMPPENFEISPMQSVYVIGNAQNKAWVQKQYLLALQSELPSEIIFVVMPKFDFPEILGDVDSASMETPYIIILNTY